MLGDMWTPSPLEHSTTMAGPHALKAGEEEVSGLRTGRRGVVVLLLRGGAQAWRERRRHKLCFDGGSITVQRGVVTVSPSDQTRSIHRPPAAGSRTWVMATASNAQEADPPN